MNGIFGRAFRGRFGRRDTERRWPCEDGHGDWSVMSTKQGTAKVDRKTTRSWETGVEQTLPHSPEKGRTLPAHAWILWRLVTAALRKPMYRGQGAGSTDTECSSSGGISVISFLHRTFSWKRLDSVMAQRYDFQPQVSPFFSIIHLVFQFFFFFYKWKNCLHLCQRSSHPG